MNLSRTTEYGLVIAVYIAQNSKDSLVLTSTAAKECGIPEKYLTKVMTFLIRANILMSKRGPRGGHSLARPAKEISMLEIIEAMDGPIELKMNISDFTKYSPFVGNMETVCNDATAKVKGILHEAKLSEMIE